LVVNSGALSREGHPQSESRLDLFNETTGDLLVSYALGNVGAGLGGEVAITPDGRRAVLPTGDNSGRILVAELETGSIRSVDLRNHGLTGDRVLLNPLQLSADGRYAFVGNFNDGYLYVVDLEDSHASVQRTSPILLRSTATGSAMVSFKAAVCLSV
jgi:outer membrane protein assembly factor BamB